MSFLPPELKVLCFQLSSIPVLELPRHIPTLLRYTQCCSGPLSSATGLVNTPKASSSNASVLIHSLRTQLSALLGGRSLEGRFTAAILIKAIVEVGGWEILHLSGPWVRGLLNSLGKPDPASCKEMYVLTLTKLYVMAHQYQTLVRELTTPTLPAYVALCLSIVSPKAPSKASEAPSTLVHGIFHSLAMLIPRYTSILRTFAPQIHSAVRPYVTSGHPSAFVSTPIMECARHLYISLYHLSAKGYSGDEWNRGIRKLTQDIHLTGDVVLRAVVEDWESSSGSIGRPLDVKDSLKSGKQSADDFLIWNGIDAGVDRLSDLLRLLADHFRIQTPGPVAVPQGAILDVISRMLSVVTARDPVALEDNRLDPSIDREEKDGLQARIGYLYVAALKLVEAMADRLRLGFVPFAHACFDLLAWLMPHGKHIEDFRLAGFEVTTRILRSIGNSFDVHQVSKASTIIRLCCHDVYLEKGFCDETTRPDVSSSSITNITKGPSNSKWVAYSWKLKSGLSNSCSREFELRESASTLLPLFITHLPQQHLDVSLRSLIDRTAVLNRNKDAMLASILNPFIGNNKWQMASIMPHLNSAYSSENIIEILLRPRMPLLPTLRTQTVFDATDTDDSKVEGAGARLHLGHETTSVGSSTNTAPTQLLTLFDASTSTSDVKERHFHSPTPEAYGHSIKSVLAGLVPMESTADSLHSVRQRSTQGEVNMLPEDISDVESVHLVMQLDTDSEDGMDEMEFGDFARSARQAFSSGEDTKPDIDSD